MKKPLILITPGDPEGIGPEITAKALKKFNRQAHFICVGSARPFEKMGVKTYQPCLSAGKFKPQKGLALIPAPPNRSPGYQSGWSIEKATDLIQKGHSKTLVTGPISKDRLQKAGYPFAGHTDFLAHLAQVPDVTMMLANSKLRVSLVTVHTSLKKVPGLLDRKKIRRAFIQTLESLKSWWRVKNPKIALLALNPHAGESGVLGTEEKKIITPEIHFLRKKFRRMAKISGPHPADTFFALHKRTSPKERADAVIAMYHDQGLVPVKLLDFGKTVNITLGLPFIRTSVDHGTAFDIAGKGKADPSSMESAIESAIRLSK